MFLGKCRIFLFTPPPPSFLPTNVLYHVFKKNKTKNIVFIHPFSHAQAHRRHFHFPHHLEMHCCKKCIPAQMHCRKNGTTDSFSITDQCLHAIQTLDCIFTFFFPRCGNFFSPFLLPLLKLQPPLAAWPVAVSAASFFLFPLAFCYGNYVRVMSLANLYAQDNCFTRLSIFSPFYNITFKLSVR